MVMKTHHPVKQCGRLINSSRTFIQLHRVKGLPRLKSIFFSLLLLKIGSMSLGYRFCKFGFVSFMHARMYVFIMRNIDIGQVRDIFG